MTIDELIDALTQMKYAQEEVDGDTHVCVRLRYRDDRTSATYSVANVRMKNAGRPRIVCIEATEE